MDGRRLQYHLTKPQFLETRKRRRDFIYPHRLQADHHGGRADSFAEEHLQIRLRCLSPVRLSGSVNDGKTVCSYGDLCTLFYCERENVSFHEASHH